LKIESNALLFPQIQTVDTKTFDERLASKDRELKASELALNDTNEKLHASKAALDAKHEELLDCKAKEETLKAMLVTNEAKYISALETKEKEHTAALATKEAEHIAALHAKEETLKTALATKEAEYTAALQAKDAELPEAFAAKEAQYIAALEAKDKALKLKQEEHAVCSAELLLKNEELEIIRDRIVGYQGAMLVHQRATEATKEALLELERKLVDTEKLKVMLCRAGPIECIMTWCMLQADTDKQIRGKNISITAKEKKVKDLSMKLLEAEKKKNALEKKLEAVKTLITSETDVHASRIAAIITPSAAASSSVVAPTAADGVDEDAV